MKRVKVRTPRVRVIQPPVRTTEIQSYDVGVLRTEKLEKRWQWTAARFSSWFGPYRDKEECLTDARHYERTGVLRFPGSYGSERAHRVAPRRRTH